MHNTVGTLWQAMGEATALYFRDAPSYEAWLTPSAWLAMSGEPLPGLNIGLVAGDASSADLLSEIVRRARAKKVPAMVFLAGTAATALSPFAVELGLAQVATLPLMTQLEDRGSPPPSAYTVEPITTEAGLADSHRLVAMAFDTSLEGMSRAVGPRVLDAPGTTLFLAHDDHRAVSTLTTVQAGPLVGIFSMATLPEAQRKGAGAAVLEHAMAHHRRRGARLFYLVASAAGRPLYARLGFETAAEVSVFIASPAT
jgi:GNAT superfamily N-acetyltransferase